MHPFRRRMECNLLGVLASWSIKDALPSRHGGITNFPYCDVDGADKLSYMLKWLSTDLIDNGFRIIDLKPYFLGYSHCT